MYDLIENFNDKIDVYCTGCEKKRVFTPEETSYLAIRQPQCDQFDQVKFLYIGCKNNSIFKVFRCSFNEKHIIQIGFTLFENKVIKICEYPTKYDSEKHNFNKYKKIIDNEKVTELVKALQLESFGYAIPALLYYRRIFEHIIIATFRNLKAPSITEDDFRKKRMDGKIEIIKDDLPEYINQNKIIYSILSKGIHELEEEECKKYLSIIRKVLFFSLDDMLDKNNIEQRKIDAAKKLQEISSKL